MLRDVPGCLVPACGSTSSAVRPPAQLFFTCVHYTSQTQMSKNATLGSVWGDESATSTAPIPKNAVVGSGSPYERVTSTANIFLPNVA